MRGPRAAAAAACCCRRWLKQVHPAGLARTPGPGPRATDSVSTLPRYLVDREPKVRKLERGGRPLSAGAWGTRLGGSEVGPGDTRDKGRSLGALSVMPGGGQPAGLSREDSGLYEMSGRHPFDLSLPSQQEVLDNRWSALGIPVMASVLWLSVFISHVPPPPPRNVHGNLF